MKNILVDLESTVITFVCNIHTNDNFKNYSSVNK